MLDTPWTDERVALLKKLWAEGLSAQMVAMRIGSVSRNAVLGKVHRLGLADRDVTSNRSRPKAHRPKPMRDKITRPASVARPPKSSRPMIEVRELVEPVPGWEPPMETRVTFDGLEAHHCRFPIGDPAEMATFRFCGCAKAEGLPYCANHAAIAFRPADAAKMVPAGEKKWVGGGKGSQKTQTAAGAPSKREMEDA